MADALASLGTQRALVVHGAPGLDEISPLGPTEVLEVHGGVVTAWQIDPMVAEIDGVVETDLAGGEPADNARLIQDVLQGSGPPGARAAVVLNAAAALYVADRVATFAAAVQMARKGLDAGTGASALDRLRRASHTATR